MHDFGFWLVTLSLLPLLLLLLVTLVAVFEIWMFVDAIRNPRLSDTEKLLWCVGMLFIHPVVAIVYYLLVYSKRNTPPAV